MKFNSSATVFCLSRNNGDRRAIRPPCHKYLPDQNKSKTLRWNHFIQPETRNTPIHCSLNIASLGRDVPVNYRILWEEKWNYTLMNFTVFYCASSQIPPVARLLGRIKNQMRRLKSVFVPADECVWWCVCLSDVMNRVSIHMLVEQSYCRVQLLLDILLISHRPILCTVYVCVCVWVCELMHIAAVVQCCCMVVVDDGFLLCSLQCCVCVLCVCVFVSRTPHSSSIEATVPQMS